MSIDPYLLMVILSLIVVPPLIYYRQKVFDKKSKFISTQCPACMSYQDIDGLKNYTCKKCSHQIEFYDTSGIALSSVDTYKCIHCEEKNFKGILTCVACGLTNKAGIPS